MNLVTIINDLQKRLANTIRRGKIHSVDFRQSPPRVRVQYAEEATTTWLPFLIANVDENRQDWEPITVGTSVLLLSECGDLNNAVVLPSIPNADYKPPSTSPDEHVTKYSDGTSISYNFKEHKLDINIGSDGDAALTCKTFFINADIEHTGNQLTTGDMAILQSATITQNLVVGNAITAMSISDKTRTMGDDRIIYNGHTHQHSTPNTSSPNQKQ